MILYLTSDPGGAWDNNGHPTARPFKKENKFIYNLRKDIREFAPHRRGRKCLIISAAPDNHQINDEHLAVFTKSFKRAWILFDSIEMCDSRNPELVTKINDYSLVFLMGGHAPTQNKFFKDIDLKKYIVSYNGILLTLSAGSMNCAKEVYMMPEEAEEFDISISERLVPGLGLTTIQMVPHFQYLRTLEIDGQKLIDDFVAGESIGMNFTGVCDGSYYRIDTAKQESILYGEAYSISNKKIRPLS